MFDLKIEWKCGDYLYCFITEDLDLVMIKSVGNNKKTWIFACQFIDFLFFLPLKSSKCKVDECWSNDNRKKTLNSNQIYWHGVTFCR